MKDKEKLRFGLESRKKTGLGKIALLLWRSRYAYLFLTPLMISILVFCYYPPISGIVTSFFEWQGGNSPKTFIGFDNYIKLFNDSVFLKSIGTMFIILIPKLLIGIFAPLIMAEFIFNVRSTKLKSVYRIIVLLPMVAPGVVNTLLWKFIYQPDNGLLNAVLELFGVLPNGNPIDWLNDEKYVLFAVIFMGFPWIGGTNVLIYMAGLMSISKEVMEASELDGCSIFRRVFAIDLPQIVGQIRYFLIFGLIGGFQDYGVQVLLTDGGPANATMVPGYYMYLEGMASNRGYANAVGTVIFVVVFAFTMLTFKITGAGKFETME